MVNPRIAGTKKGVNLRVPKTPKKGVPETPKTRVPGGDRGTPKTPKTEYPKGGESRRTQNPEKGDPGG